MLRTIPLLTLLLVACGPLEGRGPDDPTRMAYEPLVLRVSADEPTALAAVERYVASMGWSVDEVDTADPRVVAHVDTKYGFTLQRDTWTFHATPGSLSVYRRMALGDTNGTSFVTSNDVCATYTYAAEEAHLARIAALIASAERSQRMARRPATEDPREPRSSPSSTRVGGVSPSGDGRAERADELAREEGF